MTNLPEVVANFKAKPRKAPVHRGVLCMKCGMDDWTGRSDGAGRFRCRICATERNKKHYAKRAKSPEQRAYENERSRKWRDAVLTVLGGKCVRCGFADARALQIDHVNSDGPVDQRRKATVGAKSYYMHVIQNADSGRYQLLCANCNWIKRHELGEHNAATRAR